MFYQIAAGLIFSVTIALGAFETPVSPKLKNKTAVRLSAAAVFCAADILMLYGGTNRLPSEYSELAQTLVSGRDLALSTFPAFLKGIVGGIHSFIINAAEFFSDITGKLFAFFDSGEKLAAFMIPAAVLSVAAVIFIHPKELDKNEDVSVWKAALIMVKGAFADSFFAAPVGAAFVYGVCCLAGISSPWIICTALWLLAYIPVIGPAVGIIFGICVLLFSVHPLGALIFGIVSAAVFLALQFGKNFISARFEIDEVKNAHNADSNVLP